MATTPEFLPQDELDDVFDEFDPDDDVGLIDTQSEVPRPYGFTWTYDFNAEDLDFSAGNPPIVAGLGTVNEWILHTINTERNETPIFGSTIGTDIFSMVGDLLDPYVITRVQQEVKTAVEVHDRIEEVEFISAVGIKGSIYAYLLYITDDTLNGQALIQVR